VAVPVRLGPRTLRRLRVARALRVDVRGVAGRITVLRPR
jgi:hypothetical protein